MATDPVRVDRTGAPLVLSVPEAGRMLRLSRGSAYSAAARGEIPTIRIGRRLLVPTHRLLEMLGGPTPKFHPDDADD